MSKIIILIAGVLLLVSCNKKPSYTTLSKKAIRLHLLKTLDDPASYRPVDYVFDTSRVDYPGYRVEHLFRAKNEYGAVVLNAAYFNIDSNFQVESVEDVLSGSHEKLQPDDNSKK
jgi:hypothetical protein